MTTSKIKIKLGAIEVEYEGSESFLKEELPQLLSAVSDLYAKSRSALEPQPSQGNPNALLGSSTNAGGKPKFEATTGSIAAKLNCKSGPELIMAAAARLTFVLQESTLARQKIIDEMKTATAYYKASYVSNLTVSLNNLVKDGKLNEPSQGKYALTAASLKDLEQHLV
ncbi:hypothetical protein [Acidovorax sp. Leaf73]|uniref:hypothetical protein n=1 Tax=Acidovorax sp. Leaf73 TaxID=2876566 RepID=UPI001E475490|nr:hypothetical protein [Acidovorax sp. Leaf73]